MFNAAAIDRYTNQSSSSSTPSTRSARQADLSGFAPSANTGSVRSYQAGALAVSLDSLQRLFFDMRVREWLADTKWESSTSRITGHRRFIEIVQMQDVALKLILERMEGGEIHIHWFPALKDIARHDPVPIEKRGHVSEMAKSWLEWGKNTGRI